MREIIFEITPGVSCNNCQIETRTPYWLDYKPFCMYKCAFRWVWKIIFGEIIHVPEIHDYCRGIGYIHITAFDGVMKEGLDDSAIKQICLYKNPSMSKLSYDRQKWCFELAKVIMKECGGKC